ncbi:PPOX_FMN_cyano, PPOX class probable FMN-dependent enzyme, alr4036 family [Rhabdaerophilaceae bacterium]
MPREPVPSWADDLYGTLSAAWTLLARGAADRRSPCHHPVIATIGLDGRPRQRVMILRAVDVAQRTLRVHTDLRSDKISDLQHDPRVALLVYDPGAKAQIRLDGRASLHADGAVADAAWAGSQPMSKACYGTMPAPGSDIAQAGAFTLPFSHDPAAIATGRVNFAAVQIHAERLEWLYLAHEGHRRALFRWDADGAMAARWLVP